MRIPLTLVALALLTAPLPAVACSVVPGYRVPTNMELVESADLILLATVSDGDFAPDSTSEQQIQIQPVAALKGAMPAEPLAMPGMIAAGADALLSNPYELKEAHPQSLAGACARYMFPRGSRVLFFLSWQDDHWRAAGGPFSRWAEDVLTDEAPWLQVVRIYAEAAGLPATERIAYLTARRAEYGAEDDNPMAQLIAADIDRQLAGPNAPLNEELPAMGDAADAAQAAAEAEAAAVASADR
ncbi:hypothetical protein [Sphingopyxis witflariensis]|uniref:Uncharacterized protein n=1 Tax=Sphingopyxis witflariensis TaxID=173675 RepID=A0A2D0AN68_9SPHN|nr:hypothetical protein [Sphingopyxis witflariensis]OWQ95200.1 hypothetical protein CDQ91_14925 [Sphingopyxis witflariensis]